MSRWNTPCFKDIWQLSTFTRTAAVLPLRRSSVLDRGPPNYEGHVPLTRIEQGTLAIGSALMSLLNPRRAGRNNYN